MRPSLRCLPVWVVALALLAADASNAGDRLTFEFRDFKTGNPDFRHLNNASKTLCTADEKGLTVAIPKHRTEPTIAGLVSNFSLKGDFEVTMRFDGLTPELPPARGGTGVSVWISLDSDPVVGASTTRTLRLDGPFFVANRMATDGKGKEKYTPTSVRAPADQASGRLRLSRLGKTLRHSVSVGDSAEFKEIHAWEIGLEDVHMIRFQGSPGGLEFGVTVRLVDVDIRADTIVRSGRRDQGGRVPTKSTTPDANGNAPPPVEEKRRSKLGLWVASLGGIFLIAAMAILAFRKKRN